MVCERKWYAEQTQRDASFVNPGTCDPVLNQSNIMSDDKPFACKVPGCNQKFVNEDHLEVHRKKHDVNLGILNLKSLDTPVIADQTPTPTRFLKHLTGDDVLFNDLPSNPFDMEFRKAASTKMEGTDKPPDEHIPVTESPMEMNDGGPELPTTLGSIASQASSMASITSSERDIEGLVTREVVAKVEEVVVKGEPKVVADVVDNEEAAPEVRTAERTTTMVIVAPPAQPTASIANQTMQLQNMTDQLALNGIPLNSHIMIRLPTGQTIPILPPSVTNPQEPIPTAISANPAKEMEAMKSGPPGKTSQNNAVKMKLKTALLSSQSQGNMNVMTQAVDVVTRQQEVKVINHTPTDLIQESGLKRQHSNDDDPEMKRQKFLERNRAAAMRCRTKRKQWITNLEKRADELTTTNISLNNEVTKLRNEVAQLKELLLAHKECPITLQQREAGLFMRDMYLTNKSANKEVHSVITLSSSNSS